MSGRTRGDVYICHFDRPIHHAEHYTGFATDVPARIEEHRAGRGARLLAVCNERGIGWSVVRIWRNVTRRFERCIKKRRFGPIRFLCPVCARKETP